jgi:hypothetical protein
MNLNHTMLTFSAVCLFVFACKTSSNDPTPSGAVKDCSSLTGLEKVVCLAENFKATLSTSQLAAMQLDYTKANAVKWSNLPQALTQTKRVGISFGELNATQKDAAQALLKEVTGTGTNEGYSELLQIMGADNYLNSNGGGSTYGDGNYYIAFLGTPSTTGLWELQFGGHHFALANSYNQAKLVGATPSFRAVEPMAAFALNGAQVQPIEQERKAFSDMLKGLSTTELTTARLTSTFSDLLLGPGKDGQFPTAKSGIKVGDLTLDKKNLVLNAIKTYVQDLDDLNASAILSKYTSELEDTYIAYSGTTDVNTQNDYVRIDGPNVWIEYSAQGGIVIRNVSHPHSVWRDRSGDYGGN